MTKTRGGLVNGHVWHGLTTCWIHEGECLPFHGCNKPYLARSEAKCSELDSFRRKDGFILAFRRAVDALTAYFDERNRAKWNGEYTTLQPVNLKELRRALWSSYREATISRKPRRIAEPRTLKDADRILDRLGVFLLSKGDKAGWSACDDAGHVLRRQGKVILEEGS